MIDNKANVPNSNSTVYVIDIGFKIPRSWLSIGTIEVQNPTTKTFHPIPCSVERGLVANSVYRIKKPCDQ